MKRVLELLPYLALGLAVALAVQACNIGSQPTVTQARVDPTQRLKTELETKLRLEFSEWKVVETNDLPSDDRKLWLEAHPDEQPGIITGRFRSKAEVSFAVLLIPRVSSQNGFRLLVAVPRKSVDFDFITLEQWDKPQPTLVISKVMPGEYLDAERGEMIKVGLDSIFLETPEVGGTLYYWSSDRFKKIIVSE